MTTIKKTTIYITMGDKTQVFRSPEEIPDGLRKKLMASTRGLNSATILIADRGGRAEIRKVLRGEDSALKSRLRNDYLRETVSGMGKAAGDELGREGEVGDMQTAEIGAAGEIRAEQGESLGHAGVERDRKLSWRDWGWMQWGELLLPGAVGLGLWLLFALR